MSVFSPWHLQCRGQCSSMQTRGSCLAWAPALLQRCLFPQDKESTRPRELFAQDYALLLDAQDPGVFYPNGPEFTSIVYMHPFPGSLLTRGGWCHQGEQPGVGEVQCASGTCKLGFPHACAWGRREKNWTWVGRGGVRSWRGPESAVLALTHLGTELWEFQEFWTQTWLSRSSWKRIFQMGKPILCNGLWPWFRIVKYLDTCHKNLYLHSSPEPDN